MYLSFQLTDSAFVSYCRKEGETHHEKGGFSDTAFGVVHLTDGHKKAQKAQKQPKSFCACAFVALTAIAIAVSEPLSTSQMCENLGSERQGREIWKPGASPQERYKKDFESAESAKYKVSDKLR